MKIGIPKEIADGERRVACAPGEIAHLQKLGHEVLVQSQAGDAAGFYDADFIQAGAQIRQAAEDVWIESDLVCKIRPPMQNPTIGKNEADFVRDGKILAALFAPAQNQHLARQIAEIGGTVIALDAVPRVSRAQKMDVLSSMASVAGYRAVVEAGHQFGGFFTGQVTAAGKIPPAKILVIGAGVAGLAAIGAAVGMGAVVRAFDTRPEVREQIESMDAEFLELNFSEDAQGEGGYAKIMSDEFIRAEMALFARQAKEVDIIISTALIPGKPAPKLITAEMVKTMKPGSVIVDLAAEQGGNCQLTRPGESVNCGGVFILGFTDLASRMAPQASRLFAANARHLIAELTPHKDGKITVNLEDEVQRAFVVAHQGKILWPPPPMTIAAAPKSPPKTEAKSAADSPKEKRSGWKSLVGIAACVAVILGVGAVAPESFMGHFTVFVLACFIGWQVIWNVSPALHTPLMSVTNAISGIIVVGAILQAGAENFLAAALAIAAVFLASINIAGGFLVTRRMLNMFRRE